MRPRDPDPSPRRDAAPSGRGLAAFLRDERGDTGAIEFLLVFPILIVMVSLIVQFALLFSAQLVVDAAAAHAARSAVVWIPMNLQGEPRNLLQGGGSTKRGHVEEAAALSCLAITPGGGQGPVVGGANLARASSAATDRIGPARERTRVFLDGGHYAPHATVRVRVEHDFVLRVPVAASLLGRSGAGGHVLTLRAESSLPNQGRPHGEGLL